MVIENRVADRCSDYFHLGKNIFFIHVKTLTITLSLLSYTLKFRIKIFRWRCVCIKVILVPVDIAQEELTSKAIRQAVQFAKVSGAKLNFIHVLSISSAIINTYSLGYMEIKDHATLKAEDDMQNLPEPIDLPADRMGYTIAFSSPRDEVVSRAEEINSDIIILSSRSHNITTHLLGSTAAVLYVMQKPLYRG